MMDTFVPLIYSAAVCITLLSLAPRSRFFKLRKVAGAKRTVGTRAAETYPLAKTNAAASMRQGSLSGRISR